MPDAITTICLVVLTLMSLAATALAWVQLRGSNRNYKRQKQQDMLVLTGAIGSALVFLYRFLAVHHDWQPLASHVDGLLIISALLGVTVLYLQSRSRVPGLAAFALPLLTLVLAWSICASYWTFEAFKIDSAWTVLHLAGVYLGTMFLAIGSVAGVMYLFVQHKLRDKQDLTGLSSLASLETIERVILRSTGMGFGLLTLGLITGLIIVTSGPNPLGPGWWHTPKVGLAVLAWLLYALLINVKHASLFRGARAAWLSIVGIVLVLAVFGVVDRNLRHDARNQPSSPPTLPPVTSTREVH